MKTIFLGALIFLAGCASSNKNNVSSTANSDVHNRGVASDLEIPQEFRAKVLNGLQADLRSGKCPQLSSDHVMNSQGIAVQPWHIIEELFNQKNAGGTLALTETLTAMVQGSASSIIPLDNKTIPAKYQSAYEDMLVRGPQRFFVLSNAGSEQVLFFGPYRNAAVRCQAVQ